MFRLTSAELRILRSQFVTSSLEGKEPPNLRSQIATSSWGGRRYLPYGFTENGVGMLASVLRSGQAIEVNIAIVRAFTQLRGLLERHQEIARQLEKLEERVGMHDAYIVSIFKQIKNLTVAPSRGRRRIGLL